MSRKKRMEEEVLLQKGNILQIKFNITHKPEKRFLTLLSQKYACGATYFELRAYSARGYSTQEDNHAGNINVSARFVKMYTNNLVFTCKLSSVAFNKQDITFSDDDIWHHVAMYDSEVFTTSTVFLFSFDVTVQIDLAGQTSPFAPLYDELESTDFKLFGEGGSVQVHKLILKASSPVLQAMLNGDWKETNEGKVTVPNTTKETLEHFKSYIYLNKLPETGIEQLLLVGSYYMLPDLVQKCVAKLLNSLEDNNVIELLEFASKFKVTNLLIIILHMIKVGRLSIEKVSEQCETDMCQAIKDSLLI